MSNLIHATPHNHYLTFIHFKVFHHVIEAFLINLAAKDFVKQKIDLGLRNTFDCLANFL